MPTYEYQCAACGNELEAFQSFSEKPLKKCPECGKSKLERLISGGSGLVFKGSGFYETDYKRGTNSEYKKSSDADTSSSKPAAETATSTDKVEKSKPKAKSIKESAPQAS